MDFKKEAIDLLTDEEFDFAFELIRKNRIPLQSVDNARRLSNFAACDGKTVKDNLLIRSGSLARISPEDAEYLKNTVGLSLIIDLRTPKEIEKSPDKIIPDIPSGTQNQGSLAGCEKIAAMDFRKTFPQFFTGPGSQF